MTGADVWLWAALALAVINLALLLVLLLRGPRRPADVATREELQHSVEQAAARHGERLERGLRQELGDGARSSRQELAQSLAAFQTAVTAQGAEAVRTQNAQVDALAQQLTQLRGTLGDTLVAQLQALGLTMTQQAQETTRTQNAQLDALAQQLAQLRAGLSQTLTEQLQQLSEANARRIAEVRATLEQQLAQLQTSNSAKLDQMRQTVDEKLHATLEQRLGESFKQVAERLELVHRGLGEMQTLAQGVGDLQRVFSNVKSRGVFGEIQLAGLIEQVFTPEHITDFIYRILEVNQDDRVLDATCGSGGFLVKAMANMIDEAGGVNTEKAREIKQNQLFGIEFDREIYALACANMLIHKDGKTNLEQLDARSEEAGKWIGRQNITKVLMNPPYEKKYGCMDIVENVLDSVPPHTSCAFILPDKKLEKTGKKQMARIFEHHRLRKVVKLPEDLFFGIGMTTSIFVFETGVPQSGHEFFTCWMKDDGLETVKNKGRHDVHDRWPEIERYWIDVVSKQSGDDTCVWESPDECLSYQVPVKPFEISEEDFRKTAMDYLMYKKGIDAKAFSGQLFDRIMYSATIDGDEDNVIISLRKR